MRPIVGCQKVCRCMWRLVVTAGIVRDSEGLMALLVPEEIDCLGNAVAWLGC